MSTITKLINNKFGGIRRKMSAFSEELITCSDCQNVELFYTKLNAGIGVRTSAGNQNITKYKNDQEEITSIIGSDEEVIGLFETIQDGDSFMIAYVINATKGKLYKIDTLHHQAVLLADNLTRTRYACGTDFTQGHSDYFIFSNGKDMVYVYTDTTTRNLLQVESSDNLKLIDEEGRKVRGLGLVVFDSRLWVFDGKVLWYSQTQDCRNFTPAVGTEYDTNPGYIEFVKDITAIALYLGSLAVFHSNSSCLVTLESQGVFAQGDESPGGCAGYNSLIFHGTDLYFYDDTKKGVFSFKQIVNGDKTLSDNIAEDLQEELSHIDSKDLNFIKTLSVITEDRNEVWFLIPTDDTYTVKVGNTDVIKQASIILIFDYVRGEWLKRKCQHINAIAMVGNKLFSAGKEIYYEYYGNTFDGDFIDSYYVCSIFNLGEDNTMKITKFPPRLTVDGNYMCDFWVRYVKNYQAYKKPKEKHLKTKKLPNIMKYDSGYKYNSGYIYVPSALNSVIKAPSATFKALEIRFYTQEVKQRFAIKAIEFSKLKVKQV